MNFHVEPGAVVPRHAHPRERVGHVARGPFTFAVGGDAGSDDFGDDGDEDETFLVGPGDSYRVPPDEPHAVRNETEEPVTGVDAISPPRADPNWPTED